ncbi:MAG: septum formation family protein [Wenzhouxiangellaceae bacterium]
MIKNNMSYGWLLLSLGLLAGCDQAPERAASGELISEGTIDAFQMKVGDCFNDEESRLMGPDDEVSSVPGVPCDQPHDNEVYAIFNLTFESWPGEDAAFEIANQQCIENFAAFVGSDYYESSLDVLTLAPTDYGWKKLKDREVICSVYDMEENKLIGSMRGRAI